MWHAGWMAGLAALLVAGCGGGGSGGADHTPTIRTALPALSQDSFPAGARLDLRSSNYFPAAAGDTWVYDQRAPAAPTGSMLTRTVVAAAGGDVTITETANGSSDSSNYRRTGDGIVVLRPLEGAVPAAVSQFIGDLLDYAEPFYPVGSTVRQVRQGSWGVDLDGDGIPESYRLELTQVLIGFETVTVGAPVSQIQGLAVAAGLASAPTVASTATNTLSDVAHFRNVVTLTLQPSSLQSVVQTITSTEDAWWAPGIGLVRADRETTSSNGVGSAPLQRLLLTGGKVGGATLFAGASSGALRKIALVHNALVFDASRNRYYASVPGSVVGNGNRIAVVDGATGVLSYPGAAVGSEPWALAISADASALYVGLNGSGDVLKLRLPDLAEQWRVRLPNLAFYGQLFAERIAVSPVDADVLAVSTFRAGVSPRHGGVALVRNGVLQPTMTQDHTGSNLIAFDANGQFVYGFNNETTEFGLRRLAVLADGLRQEQVVTAQGANFASRSLAWSANGLVLDRAVYRAPDLALLGTANVAGGNCQPHSVPGRLLCSHVPAYSNQGGSLAVVDATSFVILATVAYQEGAGSDVLSDLVPGAPGQVALRMNATYFNSPADAVWLFNSAGLQ